MKNVIFTICAKNYIGLALVLKKSLELYDAECKFYIFVADEMSESEEKDLPENVIIARNCLQDYLPKDLWENMAFKYNLTEFCTSIKPFCFKYLFESLAFDKAIYLDPDIMTFSSFASIYAELDKVKIILTPHITQINVDFVGERSEKGLLSTGVFNLGFLALKRSSEAHAMLNWWSERLKEQCYIDALDSYFTDQRWMDFLPCFFSGDTLLISKNLGLNVAPWNFFEREIYKDDHQLYVKHRIKQKEDLGPIENESYPLIFVHFSGYDYKSLLKGDIVQNNIQDLGQYKDIEVVCILYSNLLKDKIDTFNLYIKNSYTYSVFQDETQITHFHRRLYRSLVEEGKVISSPFSVLPGSLYSELDKKKLLIKSIEDNVDKLNKLNMPDSEAKLKKINWLMRRVFQVLGVKKFTLLLRLMRPYSRIENQIHLVDSKYGGKLK